jgi:hypothetical protein
VSTEARVESTPPVRADADLLDEPGYLSGAGRGGGGGALGAPSGQYLYLHFVEGAGVDDLLGVD